MVSECTYFHDGRVALQQLLFFYGEGITCTTMAEIIGKKQSPRVHLEHDSIKVTRTNFVRSEVLDR
jgi:hypothetical protein